MVKNLLINLTGLGVLLSLVSAPLTLTPSVELFFFVAVMLVAFFLLQSKKEENLFIFSLKMFGVLIVSKTGFAAMSETGSEVYAFFYGVAIVLTTICLLANVAKDFVKEMKGSDE